MKTSNTQIYIIDSDSNDYEIVRCKSKDIKYIAEKIGNELVSKNDGSGTIVYTNANNMIGINSVYRITKIDKEDDEDEFNVLMNENIHYDNEDDNECYGDYNEDYNDDEDRYYDED